MLQVAEHRCHPHARHANGKKTKPQIGGKDKAYQRGKDKRNRAAQRERSRPTNSPSAASRAHYLATIVVSAPRSASSLPPPPPHPPLPPNTRHAPFPAIACLLPSVPFPLSPWLPLHVNPPPPPPLSASSGLRRHTKTHVAPSALKLGDESEFAKDRQPYDKIQKCAMTGLIIVGIDLRSLLAHSLLPEC